MASPDWLPDGGTIGWGLSALTGGALGLRHFLSKQGVSIAADGHQKGVMNDLREERNKAVEKADSLQKMIDELHENNALLRSQVAMMRLLLIQKGITEAELIAIGAGA